MCSNLFKKSELADSVEDKKYIKNSRIDKGGRGSLRCLKIALRYL
jgi:hypothetical protein